MLATIRLDFDPTVPILGLDVRAETIALAGVVVIGLLLAALGVARFRARDPGSGLRRDDLLLIALGAMPGAVVGGRLEYVLIHLDYYRVHAQAAVDPGQGGSSLTLAVVFATACGLAVARLLAAPLRQWLHVAAVPVLVVLGLGKLGMVLGGAGQGAFGDGHWSTLYLGSGPWESALPERAAVASQAVEGLLVLAVVALILVVPVPLRFRVRRWHWIVRPGWSRAREWSLLSGGRRFLVAFILWAGVRFAVAYTWRDDVVWQGLRTEQLILACLIGLASLVVIAATSRDLVRSRAVRGALARPRTEGAPGRP